MKSIATFFILALLLIGCNRGCTTASTMDKSTRKIVLHGEEITITARLVDYRNSRAINRRNVFRRKVTHSYGVEFDLNCKFYEQSGFYYYSVTDPENVDLDAALKTVKVALSKNKEHLALGAEDKVISVVHFYNGKPLRASMSAIDNVPSRWSDLNIEGFPSVEEQFRAELTNCNFILDEAMMQSFMNQVKPSDTLHRYLLNEIGSCRFAKRYYTPSVVAKLSQNARWKSYAKDAFLSLILNEDSYAMEKDFESLLQVVNDSELYYIRDSMYMQSWGESGFSGDNKIKLIAERMQDKNNPMPGALKSKIVDEARLEFRRFTRSGNSNSSREAYQCAKILLAAGEFDQLASFLNDAFGPRMKYYDSFDLIECLYKIYDNYPPDMQKEILAHSDHVMENIKYYTRSSLARAMNKIVDCSKLKEWMQKYPDDISEYDIRDGC